MTEPTLAEALRAAPYGTPPRGVLLRELGGRYMSEAVARVLAQYDEALRRIGRHEGLCLGCRADAEHALAANADLARELRRG